MHKRLVQFASCPCLSPLTFHSAADTYHVTQVAQKAAISRSSTVSVRAQAVAAPLKPASVPLVMEEGPMPINTFGPKAPFLARIRSVEKIVGPKATGETFHVIIETDGKIPYWEGQSYGVIPPVRRQHTWARTVHHGDQHSMADWRWVGAGPYLEQCLIHLPDNCWFVSQPPSLSSTSCLSVLLHHVVNYGLQAHCFGCVVQGHKQIHLHGVPDDFFFLQT